jgi:serine/threonine-protein kinase
MSGIQAAPSVGPDVVSPRSGEAFSSGFSLRSKLGDGGTATVWLGVSRTSGELVACKLLARDRPAMRWHRAVRTFEHEAGILERCQHERIVRLLGIFQGPRDLILNLEYMSGGDVQQLLQRHGALAEHAVAAIIRQLAGALKHVHSQRVLHRDVKLENLLVARPGAEPSIKLCDFGHAAAFDEAKDSFTGTVGYSAPEVSGKGGRPPEWSVAADVWSVGTVMYCMLANSPLRWARDGPDFSSRLLLKVSTRAKLLIK